MTIKMETELRDRFMAVAAAIHRPAAQIMRDLMRSYIARQEEPNEDTVAAIAAVERGEVTTHDSTDALYESLGIWQCGGRFIRQIGSTGTPLSRHATRQRHRETSGCYCSKRDGHQLTRRSGWETGKQMSRDGEARNIPVTGCRSPTRHDAR